ncbi:MAG: FGGY family carbohydrate kinase [Bacteroidales bacterium]
MYLLGYDIGSSSVKASLVDSRSGKCVASDFFPKQEMKIIAHKAGWAEQDPECWWENLQLATRSVMNIANITGQEICAIGISYQMHGLVVADKKQQVLRPAIIWCDSRGVPYGQAAFNQLGEQFCLEHLLNTPGNFTATKLAWIKENEPDLFEKIDKIMLPGDYIAMKLTGDIRTTVSGLSEGIFWDFRKNEVSAPLLEYFGFDREVIAPLVPTFGIQGTVSQTAASLLGLKKGIPVSYRAGDQPNNALSLNVLEPGEIASTAGTSGVVYGVLGSVNYDKKSRVNTFAHVNHQQGKPRLGVLLCINGTGILNSWIKKNIVSADTTYEEMNAMAAQIPIGSDGLTIIPFGNGAERVLSNHETGASIQGINFNIHHRAHLVRAAQEGIVFSFAYGMEVMKEMGMQITTIKAGLANMFLSPVFRETLAGVTGATIELYNTDGSIGAAKGAGIGAGVYTDTREAFQTLEKLEVIKPDETKKEAYMAAYIRWKEQLSKQL